MTVTVSSPAKYSVTLGRLEHSLMVLQSFQEYFDSVGYLAENITVVGTSGLSK